MADKIMAAMDSEDEKQGANILIKAMSAPCMQVAENAGIEGAVILSKVQSLSAEKGVSQLLLSSPVFLGVFFVVICGNDTSIHLNSYMLLFLFLSIDTTVWLGMGRK